MDVFRTSESMEIHQNTLIIWKDRPQCMSVDELLNSHNDVEEILVGELIFEEESQRLLNARQQTFVRTAEVQKKNDTSPPKLNVFLIN